MPKVYNNTKKGSALLSTLIVSTILLIVTSAAMSMSIFLYGTMIKERERLQAFYAAEMGIEYAFIESGKRSYDLTTHWSPGVAPYALGGNAVTPSPLLSGVTLNGATGCYEIPVACLGGKVEIKLYSDPDTVFHAYETLVLSRASVGSSNRILKFRLSQKSLYKYFMFWPTDYYTGDICNGKRIDGKNIGALHVNGNIDVQSGAATYNNFAEISIAGHLSFRDDDHFPRPGSYDDDDGNMDGKAPIPIVIYPPKCLQYPLSYDYALYNAVPLNRNAFDHPDTHIYGYNYTDDAEGSFDIRTHSWLIMNDKFIPKRLPDSYKPTPWTWTKYASTIPALDEQPIKFDLDYVYQTYSDGTPKTALTWLIDKEIAAGERNTLAPRNASDLVDATYDSGEFEWVTVLNTTPENKPLQDDGKGAGLYNHSEKEIYNAVKTGRIPTRWNENLENWVQSEFFEGTSTTGERVQKFLEWWKNRHYHHGQVLDEKKVVGGTPIWKFTNDSDVPAWERIFWEAWINYWPPVRGKAHNQIYTPAAIYRAINPEWWEDLTYGNDIYNTGSRKTVNLEVKYLDTAVQYPQFNEWLEHTTYTDGNGDTFPLNDVFKYASNGGKPETPLDIKVVYKTKAEAGGLYIQQTMTLLPGMDPQFEMKFNGSELARGTFDECLATLGINSWVRRASFANPSYTKASYTNTGARPPNITAIEIDIEAMRNAGVNINNHVAYLECYDYDTRLVNGFTLPAGGLWVVSPYDVYVQAQEKTLTDGSTKAAYNYEYADKTSKEDPCDPNWQYSTIITNSAVFFLSKDFNGDSFTAEKPFPYPILYPQGGYSLDENGFISDYCLDRWPASWPSGKLYSRPASEPDGGWARWVSRNIENGDDLKALLNAGWGRYGVLNEAEKMINKVTSNNYFNTAVASPEDPRGWLIERWRYYNYSDFTATDTRYTTYTPYIQGAFIKLLRTSDVSWARDSDGQALTRQRYPVSSATIYLRNLFNLLAWDPAVHSLYSSRYDWGSKPLAYEERFWDPAGRPAADLCAGSQALWEEAYDFDHHIPAILVGG